MIDKETRALQVSTGIGSSELEGLGWFQVFGAEIEDSTYARWISKEVQEVQEVQEDVYEEGDVPDELVQTQEEVFWEHYCSVKLEGVGTDKGYPCDYCGAVADTPKKIDTWTHFCNIKGHLVYTDKGESCNWCGAVYHD